ncbi:hypothetical protein MPER_09418, partial [Moniliophthora perniciosa FA553]
SITDVVNPTSFDNGKLMTCVRRQDLFVIYIAAIGHDVAHAGLRNVFMKNAQAPLSLVFDNKSPLEQMHISLLLRVMRHHGLGPLLDDPVDDSGQRTRKLLSETVLATDMSVHKTFMENFRSLLDRTQDFELCRRQLLICQAIIKCADISNPYRPYHVAKHWAEALMGEWTSQAMLEKCMRLPPTVQASNDPLTEAKGQIFFINAFAKPLLELTVEAVPELDSLLQRCKSNLSRWEIRRGDVELELQNESTESTAPEQIPASPDNSRSSADDESDVSTDYGEERIPDRLQSPTDTKLIWPSSANAGGVYQAKSEEGDLSTPPPSSYESNSGSAESIPPSPDTDSASESGSCLFSPSGISAPSASGSTSESVSILLPRLRLSPVDTYTPYHTWFWWDLDAYPHHEPVERRTA